MKSFSTLALCIIISVIIVACNQGATPGRSSQTVSVQDLKMEETQAAPAHPAAEEKDKASRIDLQASLAPPNIHDEEFQLIDRETNTEEYDAIVENEFVTALQQPLSTFSIDVDRASYSNVRRYLQSQALPPPGAVRIEEMVNYFNYNYAQPADEHPVSFTTQVGKCPWNSQHYLLHIGMQGKQIPTDNLPPVNLVFLVDVSGSMEDANKLPLVKQSLALLTRQLRPQDRVAIVVYAGAAGLVLPTTAGNAKQAILDALDGLQAGGSTAGGEGIQLAYSTARKQFLLNGNNRVVLCTDGDFNVGPSSDAELVRMIEKERESGIYLTVLGYGMGNYKDSKMQQLADKGNGNHAYIDSEEEAKKILMNEFGGTMFTIANDVKLQLEFNPLFVQAYRLVGYENRMLASEDFNDDKKDAGEIGSGHSVTALYEIIPAGIKSSFVRSVDSLRYQVQPTSQHTGNELLTIKLRYKKPGEKKSILLTQHVNRTVTIPENWNENFGFAASVAEFGLLLRNSKFRQNSSFDQVIKMASEYKGDDRDGYRAEFIQLAQQAKALMPSQAFRNN